jgi:hypothetical protein
MRPAVAARHGKAVIAVMVVMSVINKMTEKAKLPAE